jgi:hypothetical protein
VLERTTDQQLLNLAEWLCDECGELNPAVEGMFDKFGEFHQNNPHVYEAFLDVARRGKEMGKTKWGIAGVIEILRWEWHHQTQDNHYPYKISNDYKPYYARILMANNADLANFFQCKELFRK